MISCKILCKDPFNSASYFSYKITKMKINWKGFCKEFWKKSWKKIFKHQTLGQQFICPIIQAYHIVNWRISSAWLKTHNLSSWKLEKRHKFLTQTESGSVGFSGSMGEFLSAGHYRPIHVLLSRFYLDFILILSKFYPDKIRIKSG